jgi:hypothetical protein
MFQGFDWLVWAVIALQARAVLLPLQFCISCGTHCGMWHFQSPALSVDEAAVATCCPCGHVADLLPHTSQKGLPSCWTCGMVGLQLGCCDFKPAFNNPIPNLINTNLKVRTRRCSAG